MFLKAYLYAANLCVIYFFTWTHSNMAQKFNSTLNIWNNTDNFIMVMWSVLKEFSFLNLKCFGNLSLKRLFVWPDSALWHLRKVQLELTICFSLYQLKHNNACFRFIDIYGYGCGSYSINTFQVVLIRFNWGVSASLADSQPWEDLKSCSEEAAKDRVNQECSWRIYVMAHLHCQHLVRDRFQSFRPLLLSQLWYFTIHAKFCLKKIVPGFYELHSQFLFYFLLGVWRYSNLLRYFNISSLLPALCCFSSI